MLEPVARKPVVVARWAGRNPSLPCLLLNSHYDVVPAMDEHWAHDPWAATLLEDGRIVGRGTQDMKCVCVQYLLAVERLRASGFQPERNVVLSFVPDEEIGGKDGMGEFLKTAVFAELEVGFALDEGLANPKPNTYTVFWGERAPHWIIVTAQGPTGHGSRFIPGTAVSKLVALAGKLRVVSW